MIAEMAQEAHVDPNPRQSSLDGETPEWIALHFQKKKPD
jgi:hypothetical protein